MCERFFRSIQMFFFNRGLPNPICYELPLFKVVLVAALTNLGSLLGTVLYFIFVFPVLGIDPGVVISTGIQNMWTWITHIL